MDNKSRGRKRKTPYPSKELSASQSDKEEQQISNPSPQLTKYENLHQRTNRLKTYDSKFPPLRKSAYTSTSHPAKHNLVDSVSQDNDNLTQDIVSAIDFSATTTTFSHPHVQTQQTTMSQPTESVLDESEPLKQIITSSTPAQTRLSPSPTQKFLKRIRSILPPIQEESLGSLSLEIESLDLSPEKDADIADSTEHFTSTEPANPGTTSSKSSRPSQQTNSEDNTSPDTNMGKKKNKNKKPTPVQETTAIQPYNPRQQPQTSTTLTLPAPRTDFQFPRNNPSYRRRVRRVDIAPSQVLPTLLSAPVLFSYDFDNAITRCWLPSCRQRTASNDGKTVICPRCTERSYVRYCCTAHLLADFYRHYVSGECKQRENLLLIDEATMMPIHKPVREFIEIESSEFESLERVRQAIYYAQPPVVEEKEDGDYFIFSDVDNLLAGEPDDGSVDMRSPHILTKYRGTGSVVAAVEFAEGSEKKRQFSATLQQCLRLGYTAGTVNVVACGLLFVWLKEELKAMGLWDERMVTRVCFAMQLEFGYKAPDHLCAV